MVFSKEGRITTKMDRMNKLIARKERMTIDRNKRFRLDGGTIKIAL